MQHAAVEHMLEDWFAAVDEDGSGTLEHSELLAALVVRGGWGAGSFFNRFTVHVRRLLPIILKPTDSR